MNENGARVFAVLALMALSIFALVIAPMIAPKPAGTPPVTYVEDRKFTPDINKLGVYGPEDETYVLYSAYTPPVDSITEFHSYSNFPRGFYMEPYAGEPFLNRSQDKARRDAEAAMVDLNIGREAVAFGTTLATAGDAQQFAFSIENLTMPTEDARETAYTLELGIEDVGQEAFIVSFDKFEINGIAFPFNGKTVSLDCDTAPKKVIPFTWTSEQLREASIEEIQTFRVAGRYGFDGESYTASFTAEMPVFTDNANEPETGNTAFEPRREEYPVFDSDFMEVIAYDFEVVPSYGYKAKVYVRTKNYSPNLQIRLDVETNISQRENSELCKGRTDFNEYLAPNSIYKGMIYAPCVDFGDEKSDVAYLKITTTVHLTSLRLQRLEEHYDELGELDLRVVDLCHNYPDTRPMIAVTEVIDPTAERDYP